VLQTPTIPNHSPRLLYWADPRSLRNLLHGRNIRRNYKNRPQSIPSSRPFLRCRASEQHRDPVLLPTPRLFKDITWAISMSQSSSTAAANSNSGQKSAPIPPNRSQRPPDKPRDGKSKRTLIESACTACQKRKSRVSLSPSYCLCLKYIYEHILIIFPSAAGSGR
jgi:hypothetical protein